MEIPLTPEAEHSIRRLVDAGRYPTAGDVVRAAIDLMIERERRRQERLEALRREIAVGIDQADRGELLDGEEVLAELLREAELAAAEAERRG